MPYIDEEAKRRIGPHKMGDNSILYVDLIRTPGELNYAITSLLIHYIDRKGLNYTFINDCMGALASAGKEFYRRVAVPYERHKIKLNGDVFPSDLTRE